MSAVVVGGRGPPRLGYRFCGTIRRYIILLSGPPPHTHTHHPPLPLRAADPCLMDTPGYRLRYYTRNFPREMRREGGNVDKVALRACLAFLEGCTWVHRWGGGFTLPENACT